MQNITIADSRLGSGLRAVLPRAKSRRKRCRMAKREIVALAVCGLGTIFVVFKSTLANVNSTLLFAPLIFMLLYSGTEFLRSILHPGRLFSGARHAITFALCNILLGTMACLVSGTPWKIHLIGVVNLSLSFLFWQFFFASKGLATQTKFAIVREVLVAAGIVLAIGGIVQYFISPSLFGLLGESSFAQEVVKHNVSKRGVSFITSPQALAACLFLPYVLALHGDTIRNRYGKYAALALILMAGLLTGSRAFLALMAVYHLLHIFLMKSWKMSLAACLALVCFALLKESAEEISTFERMYSVGAGSSLSQLDRVQIWLGYFKTDADLFETLFGHGPGVLSRGAQILYGFDAWGDSAESFLLQLYIETGLVGSAVFAAILVLAMMNLFRVERYRYLAVVLFSMVAANMTISPAFYGISTSFLYYPIIAFGLSVRGTQPQRRIFIGPAHVEPHVAEEQEPSSITHAQTQSKVNTQMVGA